MGKSVKERDVEIEANCVSSLMDVYVSGRLSDIGKLLQEAFDEVVDGGRVEPDIDNLFLSIDKATNRHKPTFQFECVVYATRALTKAEAAISKETEAESHRSKAQHKLKCLLRQYPELVDVIQEEFCLSTW